MSLEGLLERYQLHKSCDQFQNGSLYILGKSLMNSKVSVPDLFLTHFSRSDRSLEGLLVRYQLHNSSYQLQNGTFGTSID